MTATQARALAHYSALAAQAACWASQAADAEAARAGAADAEDAELERLADDAADEYLTEAGELMLFMADDCRAPGEEGVRYYKAWNGTQLREDLTCEEIVEACIWAPAGADLRGAMYALREKLRGIAHDKYGPQVAVVARALLAAECDE